MESEEPEHYLEMEDETRHRVSGTLSKIEIALSEWDSAKDKPLEFADRIEYLRRMHNLLLQWMQNSLKGSQDPESAYLRLKAFTGLCHMFDFPGT
jgi:hypothetical protein